jgi:hypothetical protein
MEEQITLYIDGHKLSFTKEDFLDIKGSLQNYAKTNKLKWNEK